MALSCPSAPLARRCSGQPRSPPLRAWSFALCRYRRSVPNSRPVSPWTHLHRHHRHPRRRCCLHELRCRLSKQSFRRRRYWKRLHWLRPQPSKRTSGTYQSLRSRTPGRPPSLHPASEQITNDSSVVAIIATTMTRSEHDAHDALDVASTARHCTDRRTHDDPHAVLVDFLPSRLSSSVSCST